ncbi:hypothetical protein NQ176_g2458 [Zarea fungicola]|uniref:Uncharacterized protein n=1 Tax=Zarea fungicola TaxID=93591 RepID=A0ACC1NQQ2_9HYPO|nr:hypothetical protein NQ176_g2458 [Lecanicillium fungicola]
MELPATYKAAVYDEPGTISTKIVELPMPEPAEGEVLIKLTHSGVCHSDMGVMTNSWASLPAPLRRTGNAAFTLLWLFATAALFNDDMADMGLWLLEPVPVSVFRALGLGLPGDAIWRWDSYYFCWWHAGRHWWESGLAL